jgi:hypothetical protein
LFGVGSSVRIGQVDTAGAGTGSLTGVCFETLLAGEIGTGVFSQPRTDPSTIPPTIHAEGCHCIEDLLIHLQHLGRDLVS